MICRLPLALVMGLAAVTPAAAADRTYSVTGFEQVRLQGPYKVRLVTGVAPYARASGTTAALDGIAIEVSGQILTVRRNPVAAGGFSGQPAGPVEIEIGAHDLRSALVVGSGSLDINAVRGMTFSLTVEGAGAARVGDIAVDQVKLWIAGAGSATLSGSAKSATFLVRGTSSLDASGLEVRDAVIGSEGPAIIRANVSNAAKISATGVSQIMLDGAPACTVKASGSATVSGCK